MKTRSIRAIAVLTLGIAVAALYTSDARAGQAYEVTITNATRGQVITPPVVIVHDKSFGLFETGSPAIPELAMLAEDGDPTALTAFLDTQAGVHQYVVSPVPLGPGESVVLEVDAMGAFRRLTAVGMLATSNDAFFAVRGKLLPATGIRAAGGIAYDAGSEANNESCDFIPGPPCENPFVRDTAGAEGFVHVHSGIYGTGDLDPAMYGWHNPVVEMSVRQMP